MTEAIIIIEDRPRGDKIIKIVHVSGQLDESNIDEKIKDVYKLVEQNPKGLNLLFDLANLEYMNSKSIGYMTDLYGKITESSGQVVIAMARPNIIDILQVVGLTQLISTFETVDEAINHLTSTSAAGNLAGTPGVDTVATPISQAAPAVTNSIPAPVTETMATQQSQPAAPAVQENAAMQPPTIPLP